MKKELLSLVVTSSLLAPQGFLWATVTAPASIVPPPVVTPDKQDPKTVTKDEQRLMALNANIKSLETKIESLRPQYHAAVKSGDTATAEALKDQIQKAHQELRLNFNRRHAERRAIHFELVSQHRERIVMHPNVQHDMPGGMMQGGR